MSSLFRVLAAGAVAVALAAASDADAGQLLNATSVSVPLAPATTAVQFLNPDFSGGPPGFLTPSHAKGLAYGDGAVFGSFGDQVHRFTTGGAITDTLGGDPAYDFSALAFGDDTVFVGYAVEDTFGVGYYSEDFTFQDYFEVPDEVKGLAYGDDSVFVAYDDMLARYDLEGELISSVWLPSYAFGELAFGDGKLYAAYGQNLITEFNRGILAFDAVTLDGAGVNIDTGEEKVLGLAYGDGHLFASYDFVIRRYDDAGDQTDAYVSGILGMGVRNGPLAYRNDAPICVGRICEPPPCTGRLCEGGSVPEPGSWALMIIGFGGVGAALRARRRTGLGAAWI